MVQRTTALNAIRTFTEGYLVLCTYPEALVECVVGMKRLRESILTVRVGDTLSTETIEKTLIDNDFSRVDFVYEPGQYSIRGGIVDIFPTLITDLTESICSVMRSIRSAISI